MYLLRNSKDIRIYREAGLIQQNGIDPITLERIMKPTLDHCHSSGNVRKVLENNTNQFLGRVESFYKRYIKYKNLPITLPEILRQMAMYLEQDYSRNPYHPESIGSSIRKFKGLPVKMQIKVLKECKVKNIRELKNIGDRVRVYRKFLMNNSKSINVIR